MSNLSNFMINCLECRKDCKIGLFIESKFDGKLFRFCSEKCKNEYLIVIEINFRIFLISTPIYERKRIFPIINFLSYNGRIERIKVSYPKYYEKIIKDFGNNKERYNNFYQYMELNVV